MVVIPAPLKIPNAASVLWKVSVPKRCSYSSQSKVSLSPRSLPPKLSINMTIPSISNSWKQILADEFEQSYFQKLQDLLIAERQTETIFPAERDVFSAFELTPYENVNVLLLGQDPYHDDNQAHGLCFSVNPGIKTPPSLVNMYKELRDDVEFKIPNHGYLSAWAEQGILMLNSVLTVRAHTPNSHKNKGWETFTDAVISKVNQKTDPVIFVLWGAYAQKKLKLIDETRHIVIQSAHPSPLSARNGFFGSKPFSTINTALQSLDRPKINWQLSDIQSILS
jgi:uracil-DNA glycosylase